jgi:hypothetical protein
VGAPGGRRPQSSKDVGNYLLDPRNRVTSLVG